MSIPDESDPFDEFLGRLSGRRTAFNEAEAVFALRLFTKETEQTC